MANSISAEVWLDERRWDALEVVLEEQGSNIEQHLQEYLLDLYREMVPPDQVREIESDIQKEALETQREREARKVFSAFHLWENGKSRCLATEYAGSQTANSGRQDCRATGGFRGLVSPR